MARDVSIAFRASDNLTQSISSMRRSVTGLSRDVSEYRRIQAQAFDRKTEVRIDITRARQALKDLERDVRNNVEGAEEAFRAKQRALEELNEEYRRLTRVANEAGRAEQSLQRDLTQTRNQQSTMAAQQQSMFRQLANAGLVNMIGGAATGLGGQFVGSMYGEVAGNGFRNIAGGVASGAAIGMIAGPVGAAVGAAVGGLTGAIQSLTEVTAKKDDVYKDEVRSLYDQVTNERKQNLESGIATASERERLIKGLGTLLGSEEAGQDMFQDIKSFGTNTPYQTTSMIDAAKTMLAYGVKPENIMSDMNMLGEIAMGDQNKFNGLSYAYAQTQSAGKLTGQDLLQYTAVGFNPLSYLAEEQGKTLQEMRELMSDGLISSDDVTRAFQMATSEGGKFYGAMAEQMDTYAGKLSMLTDLQTDVTAGYGEGYNAKRMEGMQSEIDQLNGYLGEKMKEANSLIGEYEADLENQYQQSIIDAMTEAMETPEYFKAKRHDDGVEMGRIIAEARAQAEIDYKNSEGYKLQQEADLSLVKNIQEDVAINNAYLDYGYKMAQQFTKGYQNGLQLASSNGNLPKETSYNPNVPSSAAASGMYGVPSYSTGTKRVVGDNVPALLHDGEEVLTKVDADKRRSGQSGPVIHIANMTVRKEQDIELIAEMLYSKLNKYAVNAV